MKIEITNLAKAVLLKVSGRMDAENADEFRSACEGSIAGGARHIIAELDELQYVSSMGLRAFVFAAQALEARSGSLILCGLRGVPRQVFEMTNLLSVFPVFETRGDAIATL
ncbi:MAG TPA: STAS domain-containing protein [Bryobacteraceae bacterium]|nr:STAS domain-containing protein [Bryobacteraceae bacterium]